MMTTDPGASLHTTGMEALSPFSIAVEFTGGLEMLFSNKHKHSVTLPAQLNDGGRPNISFLLEHLVENVMKDERKELFILEGNVRPGILVLINDADWELEGEENYELQPGDNIVFVSTLHGG
ncbi:ubiquitin-related modifier 1 [Aspergillus coremiiformis]|uniref:Ubiquitin-related modifier 1 n=1 Tax=Aspergillus coremiiformis TaxID=138285 RepID=A0A5N6YTJ6_9EURO|nr:ubiquitin-related modifier 1 [Aspergillus coremiiformis]